MKKVIFGLIATIMLGFAGTAQTNEEIKRTYERNRPVFAQYMSDFVTSLKPHYSSTDTFASFSAKVSDPKALRPDASALLNKAFIYIKENRTKAHILANDTGYELALVLDNHYKVKNTITLEDYLFGKDAPAAKKGFWGTIWGAIKDAAVWVWENSGEIIGTYVACCQARLCCG